MDKISAIKKRLLSFITYQGLSKRAFCESVSMSYANMKGKGLESEIGGEQISKILSSYPELSAEWLITGLGKMIKEPLKPENINQEITGDNNIMSGKNTHQNENTKQINEIIEQYKKRIEEKDEQIRIKDEQINKLLEIATKK